MNIEAQDLIENQLIKLLDITYDIHDINKPIFDFIIIKNEYYLEIYKKFHCLYDDITIDDKKSILSDLFGTENWIYKKNYTTFENEFDYEESSTIVFEIVNPTNELFLKCFEK